MKNKIIESSPEEEIDNILGDIFDEPKEITVECDTCDTEEFDETLRDAKKFLNLMEEFDVVKGANMEKNIRNAKQEIVKAQNIIIDEGIEVSLEDNISIVESSELLEDFILVRETLREDIKATRIVLNKLSEDLSNLTAEDMNGQVVEAFASIKKANVQSMKLLIESYEKVASTQLSVKKLAQELITEENRSNQSDNVTSIQNAVFVGSPAELLESLKN